MLELSKSFRKKSILPKIDHARANLTLSNPSDQNRVPHFPRRQCR